MYTRKVYRQPRKHTPKRKMFNVLSRKRRSATSFCNIALFVVYEYFYVSVFFIFQTSHRILHLPMKWTSILWIISTRSVTRPSVSTCEELFLVCFQFEFYISLTIIVYKLSFRKPMMYSRYIDNIIQIDSN